MSTLEDIRSRRCIRAFLPKPVPRDSLEHILTTASYAPSGSNIQPWKVHVVTGALQKKISEDALAEADRGATPWDYQYYPGTIEEPYLSRRRATGWGLYGLLGIAKGDRERSAAQSRRNLVFFDAPVGLFFFLDRSMPYGSWLDYGMFVQSVMIAARGLGLDTCPQAAWLPMHHIVRAHLNEPISNVLVCGMSLGYADTAALVNTYRPEREPLAGFTTFHYDA